MTPENFAKAKEHFLNLIDLPRAEREQRLVALAVEDAEVAKEVRSLLDNHLSRTILQADVATGRAVHDSTASTALTRGFGRLRIHWIGGLAPFAMSLGTALIFGLIGWGVQYALQSRLEQAKISHLQTLVALEQGIVQQWTEAITLKVESWARSTEVRQAVLELVEKAKEAPLDEESIHKAIIDLPAHSAIEKELNALAGIRWISDEPPANCQKFAIWNKAGYTLTDWNRREASEWIGKGSSADGAAKLNRVFQSGVGDRPASFVYLPRAVSSERITADYPIETTKPQIQIMTGIRDDEGKVIAALMIRDQSINDDFERAVFHGRFEETGECYLIDKDGWMMNESRFANAMRESKIFEDYFDLPNNRASIRVSDPGGDVLRGYQPTEELLQWPRTKAARAASTMKPGYDVKGYRDYRGREVIGAWRWDDRLEAAIVVEQDRYEAYAALGLIDYVFRAAWGLPLMTAIGIFIGSVALQLSQRGKTPTQIGPYRILEKIGEGGLGVVYRAQHKLLGRPAAIKLLKREATHSKSLARFEREVQLAAKLEHPNAVSIYDYGISTHGSFYYAMEYIHGSNLADFMKYVKVLPIDRCLRFLVQLCEAIREAHLEGLVHRDIKPQNIMIAYRGGIPDVVKVLDYGLVKSILPSRSNNATETRVLMGTPKFMAPERLETPWLADPRIDIYSIGAVAYFLLAGHSPLLGIQFESMVAVFSGEKSPYKHISSQKAFRRFLYVVSRCVAPEPTLRPDSIHEILDEFRALQDEYLWQELTAEDWWKEHEEILLHRGA